MSMAIKGYLSNNQVIRTVRVAFLPFRKICRKPGKYGQPCLYDPVTNVHNLLDSFSILSLL